MPIPIFWGVKKTSTHTSIHQPNWRGQKALYRKMWKDCTPQGVEFVNPPMTLNIMDILLKSRTEHGLIWVSLKIGDTHKYMHFIGQK